MQKSLFWCTSYPQKSKETILTRNVQLNYLVEYQHFLCSECFKWEYSILEWLKCGATLVGRKWAITTADCIDDRMVSKICFF